MRFAVLLTATILCLSSQASAANTLQWFDSNKTTTEAGGVSNGSCVVATFTSATDETKLLHSEGAVLSLQFYPGAGASSVDVYACVQNDNSTCALYKWDTDGDGIGDNSALDGLTVMKRGLQQVEIAGYLYIDPSLITSGAKVKVCSQKTSK